MSRKFFSFFGQWGGGDSTKSCFHASSAANNKAMRSESQEGTTEAPFKDCMFPLGLTAHPPPFTFNLPFWVYRHIQQAAFTSMTDASTVQIATDFDVNTNNKHQLS